jgi:hypothetical protein
MGMLATYSIESDGSFNSLEKKMDKSRRIIL